MRHRLGYKKLNRTSEHRKALIKNMLNSLVKYEQITTTLPKAKVLKPQADKLITLGKKDTLQNTRTLISKLQDEASASKIRKTLSKKSFKSKPHVRQSQIINLIHQRVRAAYKNAKDPKVKARLKRAYKYATERKEASKRKTQRIIEGTHRSRISCSQHAQR